MAVYIMTLFLITTLASVSYYAMPRSSGVVDCFHSRRLRIQFGLCVVLTGIILFLVSALRYNVGTDYNNYRYFVSNITLSEFGWGKAYVLLVKLSQLVSDNYYIFIGINSLIFVILACKCLKDYAHFHPLSVYLFFSMGLFFQSFCMLRQILAIMVVFYSYRFIIKKKYVKLILGFIIAYLFHSSALIVAPAFFLANIRLKKKYYLLGLFVGIGLSPLFHRLGIWYINRKYFGLLNSQADPLLPLYSILLGLLLFFLMNVYKEFLEKKEQENNVLYNISFFYIIYTFAFAFVPVMSRCFQYFIPFFTLSIPKIIDSQNGIKQKRFFSLVVILVYFVFMCGFAIYSDTGVLPYQTIFSVAY